MLFTGLVITGLYFGAFAQRQADYSSKFQTKIQSITLDNLTGNIIGRVNSRFKALKQNNDFAYIFARGESDQTNHIVKVSKATGEEVDKIAVENSKPIYEIDYLTDNLYYVYQNELKVFSKK